VGFLRGCPNKNYLDAMIWLGRHPSHYLTTYQNIADEINIGLILHFVCGHIVFWVDPSYQPPYKTSTAASTTFYEWEDLIRVKYVDTPQYTDNPDDDLALDEEREIVVVDFMIVIRKFITKKYDAWNRIPKNVSVE
jgi:hypothetical protein